MAQSLACKAHERACVSGPRARVRGLSGSRPSRGGPGSGSGRNAHRATDRCASRGRGFSGTTTSRVGILRPRSRPDSAADLGGLLERAGAVVGRHVLPSGLYLETAFAKGAKTDEAARPSVVHLHGSYHAMWCWANFFSTFAARGYDCYAASFLGQGGSSVPPGAAVAGDLSSHAGDLLDWLESIEGPKVLVAHSFAGLIVQHMLRTMDGHGSSGVVGICLLCSVPPTGNGPMVSR